MRPTKDETFMSIAMTWSRLSTCSSRVQVGAVIVNKLGQIIASGYNGSPRGLPHCDDIGCTFDSGNHCIQAVHAEVNAIIQCAMTGTSCNECTIYVTHSPCVACSLVIAQAGISKVIYRLPYRDTSMTEKIFSLAKVEFQMFGG